MREILFRGKRLDNGKWVYGSPLYDFADCSLKQDGKCACLHDGKLIAFMGWNDDFHEYDSTEVDPATVGQYTGLRDKNGKRIFEGDIVMGKVLGDDWTGQVIWIDKIAGFGLKWSHRDAPTSFGNAPMMRFLTANAGRPEEFLAEVIGNIYDNQELLEAE